MSHFEKTLLKQNLENLGLFDAIRLCRSDIKGTPSVQITEGIYLGTTGSCKNSSVIRIQVVCETDDSIATSLPIRDALINWSIADKQGKAILKGSSGTGLSGYISIPIPGGSTADTIQLLLKDKPIQSFPKTKPISTLALHGDDCKRNTRK